MLQHRYVLPGEWVWDCIKRDYVRVTHRDDAGIKVSSGDSYLHHEGKYSRLQSRDDRQEYERLLDKIDPGWRRVQPKHSAY